MLDKYAGIWKFAAEAKRRLPVDSVVSLLSQVLVVARLAREDRNFKGHLETFLQPGNYIKDLLTASIDSLNDLAVPDCQDLIDLDDTAWSALSADSIFELMRELADSDTDLKSLCLSLTDLLQRDSRDSVCPPPEVIRCMYQILDEPQSIYLPSSDSAFAGLHFAKPEHSVRIKVEDKSKWKLLRRLYFSIGVSVCSDDSSTLPDIGSTDAPPSVLLIPPFGANLKKSDESQLPTVLQGAGRITSEEGALASLSLDTSARIVALISAGILSRGGGSSRFRRWLTDTAGLRAVVEFPERLLENTSIATALLVLDQTVSTYAQRAVALLDADSNNYLTETRKGRHELAGWQRLVHDVFSDESVPNRTVVSDEQLADNDYILQPSRYMAKESSGLDELIKDSPALPLSSIVDIRIPLPVKATGTSHQNDSGDYHEVRISDFGADGTITDGTKHIWLDQTSLSRIERQLLRPGDILVGTKGTIGKAGLVDRSAPDNLLAGSTTARLRLRKDSPISRPEYLVRYLALPQVRHYLEAFSSGSTIQFIKARDLAALPIPVPPREAQQRVVDAHLRIQQSLDQIEQLETEVQHLSNSAFDFLKEERDGGQ